MKQAPVDSKFWHYESSLQGFSLLEAILVMAILSLSALLVWPSISKVRARYELEMAVWEVHTRMNYLKYRALHDGASYRLQILKQGYAVEIYDKDAAKWQQVEKVLLSGVYLEANNSPAFHPEGTVSGLATITIANRSGTYRLSLAISGRIKVTRL